MKGIFGIAASFAPIFVFFFFLFCLPDRMSQSDKIRLEQEKAAAKIAEQEMEIRALEESLRQKWKALPHEHLWVADRVTTWYPGTETCSRCGEQRQNPNFSNFFQLTPGIIGSLPITY